MRGTVAIVAEEPTPDDAHAARLAAVVRDVLAPMIAVDKGEIEWIGVENGVAMIRLSGACAGCPGQTLTTQSVILPALQATDPTIVSVRVKISV